MGAGKRRKEIAGVLFKKLYPDKEASHLTTPSHHKKEDQWYILLTRRNVRDAPSINSKIIDQLEKHAEFQITRKAPNNTPPHCWYLIRAKSGLNGWICAIHDGIPKYKPAPKPEINTSSQ